MLKTLYRFEGSGLRMGSDRCPRFFHDSYKEIFARLLEAIRQGSGCVLLTGAPGTGKSTLIDDLSASLESRGYVVRKLSQLIGNGPQLASLTETSAHSSADDAIKVTLLEELATRLAEGELGGRPIVLVIDDAHNLSDEAFKKIGELFTLIEKQGQLLQILLAGQDWLGERMRLPAQHRIRQLVGENCTLLPLDANQSRAYIAHALSHMGWTGSPEISADALDAIHARTGGILRLINLAMSRLLVHGSVNELHFLGSRDVNTLLDKMRENHPELQHRVLAREQLTSSKRSHVLLPLDSPVAQSRQGSNALIDGHPPTPGAGQESKAHPWASTTIRKRLPKGALQWTSLGLAMATIVLYLTFGSGLEGDRPESSVDQARDNRLRPGMISGDQAESKQAEPQPNQIKTTSVPAIEREVHGPDVGPIAETGKADIDQADHKWWIATPTKPQEHRDLRAGAQVASRNLGVPTPAQAGDESSEASELSKFSAARTASNNRDEEATEVSPNEPDETEFKWWIAKSRLESTAHRETLAESPAKISSPEAIETALSSEVPVEPGTPVVAGLGTTTNVEDRAADASLDGVGTEWVALNPQRREFALDPSLIRAFVLLAKEGVRTIPAELTNAPPPSDAKTEKRVNVFSTKARSDTANANQVAKASSEREQDAVAGASLVSETGRGTASPQDARSEVRTKSDLSETAAGAKNQSPSDTTQQQGHTSSNEIDDLLAKAERALSRDRLTVPARNNAYEYYRRVLARDHDNERARAGLRKIAHRYRQLAEQRLREGDASGAQSLASRGLKISPRDRQLSAIHRNAKEAEATRQSELPELLQRAVDWLRSGNSNTSVFMDQ